MPDRDDTETQSYREEQGKRATPDPRAPMADVPIAPSTGGVLERTPPEERTTTEEERDAAEARREP